MKRLDIKIENLVRLVENDDSVCFVEESPMKQVYSMLPWKKRAQKDSFTFNTYSELKSFLKHAHIIGSGEFGTCYERFGLVFKFSNEFLRDLQRESNDRAQALQGYDIPKDNHYNRDHPKTSYVNEFIQEIFDRKRDKFKYNSPPIGYLYYNCSKVGVIYEYHKNYKDINNLVNEDIETFIKVIENIGRCNKELEDNGIYYADWKAENILYNGTDVKIIDLDCDAPDERNYREGKIPKSIKIQHDSDNFISIFSPEEQKSYWENMIYSEYVDPIETKLLRTLKYILTSYIEKLVKDTNLTFDEEKIYNALSKTIRNCDSTDLLEIINSYIEKNTKKNRTR